MNPAYDQVKNKCMAEGGSATQCDLAARRQVIAMQQQAMQQKEAPPMAAPPPRRDQPPQPSLMEMYQSGKGLGKMADKGRGLLAEVNLGGSQVAPHMLTPKNIPMSHPGSAGIPVKGFGGTTFAPGNGAAPVLERGVMSAFAPSAKGAGMMGGMPASVANLPAAPGAANALMAQHAGLQGMSEAALAKQAAAQSAAEAGLLGGGQAVGGAAAEGLLGGSMGGLGAAVPWIGGAYLLGSLLDWW